MASVLPMARCGAAPHLLPHSLEPCPYRTMQQYARYRSQYLGMDPAALSCCCYKAYVIYTGGDITSAGDRLEHQTKICLSVYCSPCHVEKLTLCTMQLCRCSPRGHLLKNVVRLVKQWQGVARMRMAPCRMKSCHATLRGFDAHAPNVIFA